MKLSILHETEQKYSKQERDYWCGPASLQMILKRFNIDKSQETIANSARTTEKDGTGRQGLYDTVCNTGLSCDKQQDTTLSDLRRLMNNNTCLIVNFVEPSSEVGHYAVVKSVSRSHITLDDPYNGQDFKMSLKEFMPRWEKRDRWAMSISR